MLQHQFLENLECLRNLLNGMDLMWALHIGIEFVQSSEAVAEFIKESKSTPC